MEKVKGSVIARGQGKEEMNRQSTEDFQGNETILYDIMMVDTCHYTFICQNPQNSQHQTQCKL